MSDGLVIRDCRLDEAEAVLTLWSQAEATASITDSAENIRRAIEFPSSVLLVAGVGPRIVGSIVGTFDGWRGNIYRLAVHPDYRRRGISQRMLIEVEKRMTQMGAKRITALVEKDHPWAVGFWNAAGYSLDERISRYVHNL